MNKSGEEINASKKEILEAVQALRPTYYDIAEVPYNVEEQKNILQSELQIYKAKIEELNRRKEEFPDESTSIDKLIGIYEMLINGIKMTFTSFEKSNDDNTLISGFCMYRRAVISHQKTGIRTKGTIATQEEIDRVVSECEEKTRILGILASPQKRAEYDAELLNRAMEIVEQKREEARLMALDEKNRGIETRRLRREAYTKEYIYTLFKKEIDDTNSVELTEQERQLSGSQNYNWGVNLYPKKRNIITANLLYPDKELDQKVSICAYGSFSFKHLFNGIDNPTMENSIGEIIGIHKTDTYGNTTEDFLIAQTMQLGHWDTMTRGEIRRRSERGEYILILRDKEEFNRIFEREQRRHKMEESRPKIEKELLKLKEKVVRKKPQEMRRINDDNVEEDVFVYRREPAKISREQAKVLLYTFYSDTMIKKAKMERFGYIGDIRENQLWFDPETVDACKYAHSMPGVLVDKYGIARKARNIGEIFRMLHIMEKQKESEEQVKPKKPRKQYPDLDD